MYGEPIARTQTIFYGPLRMDRIADRRLANGRQKYGNSHVIAGAEVCKSLRWISPGYSEVPRSSSAGITPVVSGVFFGMHCETFGRYKPYPFDMLLLSTYVYIYAEARNLML